MLCCALLWLYIDWFSISIRLTSLALWQSNDCPNASKATLMNMDKYFMWIHYERLHNHNKAKHVKTMCIFLGIYCMYGTDTTMQNFAVSRLLTPGYAKIFQWQWRVSWVILSFVVYWKFGVFVMNIFVITWAAKIYRCAYGICLCLIPSSDSFLVIFCYGIISTKFGSYI